MRLLKDDELNPLITGQNPIVTDHGYNDDWYAKVSPIQPCSIDLTIGNIYLPGVKRGERGRATTPEENVSLQRGQTAIITTRENLQLRPNLAAIGFPPSHVSFRGLLMTNPGHVDPGYVGPLHFTVINMGSREYELKRGDGIVTLLIFELSGPSHRDWQARGNPTPSPPIKQGSIDVLSKDFLDVERRAKKITTTALTKASLFASVIAIAVSALIPVATAFYKPEWRYDLEKQIAAVKESTSVAKTEARVTILETDLAAIKAATCRQSPLPAYCPPPAPGVAKKK